MRPLFLLLGLAILTLIGCGGSPIGDPCKLTSGALGFGFDDPCKTKCLELEDVTCPDGSTVRKAVCTGREGCDPGSCPVGQACYSFEDPFDKDFYCIPDDICGAPPATADERLAWERESRQRSDAIRAKFKKRMDQRTDGSTSPPAAREPKPGTSTLWLIDDDSVTPLPTKGMELNGVADVQGVVPLDSGGALLVFTTEWTGGSGVHVVGPGAGGLGPVAEVFCGS